MKTETEPILNSQVNIAPDFPSDLEITCFSNADDASPTVVLGLRRYHPFCETTVHLKPIDARKIAEMLMEHAERFEHRESMR